MTGTWPHINECTRNSVPLDRRFRVFPELMKDKSYRTHTWENGISARTDLLDVDLGMDFHR
jgi:hypothetical protein